jgi:hypothetical protein
MKLPNGFYHFKSILKDGDVDNGKSSCYWCKQNPLMNSLFQLSFAASITIRLPLERGIFFRFPVFFLWNFELIPVKFLRSKGSLSVSVGQFFGLCGSRSTQFPLALANNKVWVADPFPDLYYLYVMTVSYWIILYFRTLATLVAILPSFILPSPSWRS